MNIRICLTLWQHSSSLTIAWMMSICYSTCGEKQPSLRCSKDSRIKSNSLNQGRSHLQSKQSYNLLQLLKLTLSLPMKKFSSTTRRRTCYRMGMRVTNKMTKMRYSLKSKTRTGSLIEKQWNSLRNWSRLDLSPSKSWTIPTLRCFIKEAMMMKMRMTMIKTKQYLTLKEKNQFRSMMMRIKT